MILTKNINLIFAIGLYNEIGLKQTNNKLILPWNQKNDLLRFKQLTKDNIVIMGTNTFKSISSQPLKNRENIILSNSLEKTNKNNLLITDDINEIINKLNNSDKEIFIIGGNKIFEYFINNYHKNISKIYITKIINDTQEQYLKQPSFVFMNNDVLDFCFDKNIFNFKESELFKNSKNNDFDYFFINCIRK